MANVHKSGQAGLTSEDLCEWVKDSDASLCMQCAVRFTFFKRRHHCRMCGRVLCSTCSSNRMDVRNISKARVCDHCCAWANFKLKWQQALPELRSGAGCTKYPSGFGSPQPRFVYVKGQNFATLKLCWTPVLQKVSLKTDAQRQFALSTITQVRRSLSSNAMKRHGTKALLDRCFCIVTDSRTLNLQAEDVPTCEFWLSSLECYLTLRELRSPAAVRQGGLDLLEDLTAQRLRQRAEETDAKAQEKREQALREEKKLEEPEQCCVCFDALKDTAIVPCGHVSTCMTCARKLDKCPICRGAVTNCVRVYRV